MREYDIVVIGAGPGGYETALEAAGTYGMKTALIEKEALGGTCLNHGCIPTKTLLHSADLYREIRECSRFGLTVGEVSFDMEKIQDRKEEVLNTLRSGIAMQMKQKKVTVIEGTGRLVDGHTVEAVRPDGSKITLDTEFVLIATGSRASLPPIPGADLPGVMTSDGLLESRTVPEHLLIIGGGVIGMEFASVYSSLGVPVTVLEALPRIIANLDKELSQSLKLLMKKRGVTICTGAMVKELRQEEGRGIVCVYTEKEEEKSVSADQVLICTGRRPCTEGLFSDGCIPEMEKGRVLVNAGQQTSIPSVYAIGDVTGGLMLAHAASAMGKNALAHMNGKPNVCDLSVIPSCIYTSPEIASVGLDDAGAKEKGLDCASRKIVMSANGKTVLSAGERGFIKVVYEKETGRIRGAQMMCERASDLIGEFAQAVTAGATLKQMYGVIRPHPTFCEAITEACRPELS